MGPYYISLSSLEVRDFPHISASQMLALKAVHPSDLTVINEKNCWEFFVVHHIHILFCVIIHNLHIDVYMHICICI